MKLTSITLAGAVMGLAQAGPVTKRAISDGKIFLSFQVLACWLL